MLRAELVHRVRAEIVRRHLTAPRTVELFGRFEGFLRSFPGEAGPLLAAVRRDLATLRPGRPRPSGIWSETGQKSARQMLHEYEASDSFVRQALVDLLLPEEGDPAEGEHERVHVYFLPILVSIRKVVDLMDSSVQGLLRRGLCLRLRIEYCEHHLSEEAEVKVEGTGADEDLAQSTRLALAQVRATEEIAGRFFVRAPEVLRYVPLEGNSTSLALYDALNDIAHDRIPGAECAVTGALDPQSGRVMEVSDLAEKAGAAKEAGLHRVFFPSVGDAGEESRIRESALLVGIAERDPKRFVREARRRASPGHVRLADFLKTVLFFGLCALAVPLARFAKPFIDAAGGVHKWIEQSVSPSVLQVFVFASVGLPLIVFFIVEPFLVFILVFGALSDQVECLVNWMKFHRWETGLAPAGPTQPFLARQRTPGGRAVRTFILFFLGCAFWAMGAGAAGVWYHIFTTIPKPRAEGFGWVARIALVVVALTVFFGALWAVRRGYEATRRWMRRFPVLR